MEKKDYMSFNKKVLRGIAPALAIIGVLLSKHRAAELLLFLIGIAVGVIIGYYSRDNNIE